MYEYHDFNLHRHEYMYLHMQVLQSHTRSDMFLGDYCDGTLYKTHELFSQTSQAIQLVIYFDELEVCNPLGAQSGIHKRGNSPPQIF